MKFKNLIPGFFMLWLVASCDTEPPSVTITNPADGAQIGIGDTLLVTAEMNDENLHRTQLYINDRAKEHSFTETLSYEWGTGMDTLGARHLVVTAVDAEENESSAEINVDIIGVPPTINFTSENDTVETGDDMSFIDLSSTVYHYPTTEWLWEFGDDSTSTEQNPAHEYQEAGVYDVSLTATNEFGSATVTKEEFMVVLDDF